MKICIICNEKLIFAFTENIKSLNIKKRTPCTLYKLIPAEPVAWKYQKSTLSPLLIKLYLQWLPQQETVEEEEDK